MTGQCVILLSNVWPQPTVVTITEITVVLFEYNVSVCECQNTCISYMFYVACLKMSVDTH